MGEVSTEGRLEVGAERDCSSSEAEEYFLTPSADSTDNLRELCSRSSEDRLIPLGFSGGFGGRGFALDGSGLLRPVAET